MGVQIWLLLGQDGVWGPPTMQFGGIWRFFSTARLKIGRLKDGWMGLRLSPWSCIYSNKRPWILFQ